MTATDDSILGHHPAIDALDAAQGWKVFAWQQALNRQIRGGRAFTVDTLRAEFDRLDDIGNALGGLILSAQHAGRIKRIGYTTSCRRSRAGGVIAVWIAGDGQ